MTSGSSSCTHSLCSSGNPSRACRKRKKKRGKRERKKGKRGGKGGREKRVKKEKEGTQRSRRIPRGHGTAHAVTSQPPSGHVAGKKGHVPNRSRRSPSSGHVPPYPRPLSRHVPPHPRPRPTLSSLGSRPTSSSPSPRSRPRSRPTLSRVTSHLIQGHVSPRARRTRRRPRAGPHPRGCRLPTGVS